MGGWQCDALSLPGAKLVSLYSSGHDVEARLFQINANKILWVGTPHPKEMAAAIALEKDLSQIDRERGDLEEVKLALERDKANLEREKFSSEKRWKVYSAIGAVLSAALTAATTTKLVPSLAVNEGQTTIISGPNIGLIEFFSGSNDFLATTDKGHYQASLQSAHREVWFIGTSFYISADNYSDLLFAKLEEGVNLNFLIVDPETTGLKSSATFLDSPVEEIRHQCHSGLIALEKLSSKSKRANTPGQISIRLVSEPIISRMYFFDPRSEDGKTYYVPQVNRSNTQVLPGFLVQNKTAKFHEKYFDSAQKLWNSANS